MKKTSIYLFLPLVLALAACAPSEPEPAATVEPATETLISPTATEEPATQLPEPTEAPPTEPVEDEAPTNEVNVSVIDSTYLLEVTNVTVGTTVTWEYEGGLPHTVTSDTNLFNSGTMGEGDTFSFTFTEAGEFPYYCRFHGSPGGSGMSGVVNVTEG